MTESPWGALAAPFAATDVQWRVVKLSEDGSSAQVRPQLPAAALTGRFDAVLGVGGWSCTFTALGERGLACTLGVGGVQKSAVASYGSVTSLRETAEDALAAAAGLYGVQATLLLTELPWVDYDAEAGQILYEPDPVSPGSAAAPDALDPVEADRAPLTEPAPAAPVPAKSAGQQAIDKLVDRLKAEGRGLEAAKLLNTYGGYGSDPQAARELYAKLRELLLGAA